MAAPAAEAPAAAPGGGAIAGGGGAQSAQIVQQIEQLLAQLAQSEPEPQIQSLVQQVMGPIQQLQQAVGQDTQEDMSGVPGGEAEEGTGAGAAGGMPAAGEAGGGAPEGTEGGGEHHVVEVHIGVPGGQKDFKSANKAAAANFKAKGHFGSGPKGSPPETQKAKNKAKG